MAHYGIKLRRKGYKLKVLVGLLEEKGIRVSASALSAYMGRMSRQDEQPSAIPVRKETSQPEKPALEAQRQSVDPVLRRAKLLIFGNRCRLRKPDFRATRELCAAYYTICRTTIYEMAATNRLYRIGVWSALTR